MKKILLLISVFATGFSLNANTQSPIDKDLQELEALITRINVESQYYLDLKVHKILMAKPETFLSVLESYPNTYVWYIWNDFGSTKNSFKKLEILKELEQLNR